MISKIIFYSNDYDSDTSGDSCGSYDNYYKKCVECKNITKVNRIKTELKIIMYLCNKCETIYINNLFNEKIKNINKYILLNSIKERHKYLKIKYFFIEKLKDYNKYRNLMKIEYYIEKMNEFIKNIKESIHYHPGYTNISTFIFLLRNI